jgi:hypothetical protein
MAGLGNVCLVNIVASRREMDWEKVAQTYESYFQLQDLRSFEERLSRPFVWANLTLDHAHASQFADELNRRGLEAGLDGGLLQERVAKRVLDLERLKTIDATTPKATAKARERQTGRVQNPFRDFVTEEIRKLGDKMKAIPTSVEKSRCALKTLLKTREWALNDELLDVIVLMRSEIEDSLIQDVIADWTKNRNKNNQDPVRALSSIFWSAPNGKFVEWGVSRCRFAEHFEVGGFEDAFGDFERDLSAVLSEDVPSRFRPRWSRTKVGLFRRPSCWRQVFFRSKDTLSRMTRRRRAPWPFPP